MSRFEEYLEAVKSVVEGEANKEANKEASGGEEVSKEASKEDLLNVLSEINTIIKRHKRWRGSGYEYGPMSPDNVKEIDELIQLINGTGK